MKKILISLFISALSFSACAQTAIENTTQEGTADSSIEKNTPTKDIYTWTKYGLSFEVPEGLVVSEMIGSDVLVLDTVDRSSFEGELLGEISIHPSERNLNAELEYLQDGQAPEGKEFTQETIKVGENTFTKVTFYSVFGDYMVTEYLLEKNGTLWIVKEGTDEKKQMTQTVLDTLAF